MQKVILAVIFFFTVTEIYAKQSGWRVLKPLEKYTIDMYSMKNTVAYLEIRRYYKSVHAKTYNIKKYDITVTLQQTGFTITNYKMLKRFRHVAPNLSVLTNLKKHGICIMNGCFGYISNAFMIDTEDKIWRMNRVEDVISMLDKINTPAELKLVLWLQHPNWDIHDSNHKEKYQKTVTGYRVIAEYDNSIVNRGECGHFTYKIDVNREGKITEKKLLKKEASKEGCLTMD